MANITQLKHLEHIEDEMLNHGVDGCTASVSAMKEMLKMQKKMLNEMRKQKGKKRSADTCGNRTLDLPRASWPPCH